MNHCNCYFVPLNEKYWRQNKYKTKNDKNNKNNFKSISSAYSDWTKNKTIDIATAQQHIPDNVGQMNVML